jgi:hypothetical protein
MNVGRQRNDCIFARRWLVASTSLGLGAIALVAVSGCHRLPALMMPLPSLPAQLPFAPPPPVEVPVSNPTRIPLVDPDFLWNQVVDAVDDYFRIDNEQPLRRTNVEWLEGKLITFPEVSGTMLEPWRNDAARGFERLQSTFMTIRRTATVRVINEEGGYTIDIVVMKEQEDVDQAEFSNVGAAAQTATGAIIRNENQRRQLPLTLGWYEIGRDRELEQRLMANILGRISNVDPPHRLLKHGRGP